MSDDLVASAGEQGGPCPALRTSLGVHYRQWFPKFVGFLIKDCGVRQAKAEDIVHSAYEAVWQKLAGTPVEAQRWQAATEAERTTYVRRQVLWRRGG
ncbi:hypothetical protein [Streptomyces goshikiensis]|uniref:hypothetical protein n=1 Tax=Streptomyces goshikiensis TaxID=1942 RepID=UPI003654796C